MQTAAAIIQARCGSTRFPNKVFAEICGHPLIWHVVNRLKFAKNISTIVLATTVNPLDDKLEMWATENGVKCFRGSENDVLNRYYEAAQTVSEEVIVRITADDPFKEPHIIDATIQKLNDENLDFVCNNNPPTFPEGLDCEVFTKAGLAVEEMKSTSDFEREHVTQYFYHNPTSFKMANISNSENLSYLRWTIDTETDFDMVKRIYKTLYKTDQEIFHMEEILAFLKKNPDIAKMNSNVHRSAMYQ